MQNVVEQGPDFWCWFDRSRFSYHCVHQIHAKMFSIQMFLHFYQIVRRVCTLVLLIYNSDITNPVLYCSTGMPNTIHQKQVFVEWNYHNGDGSYKSEVTTFVSKV